jgi:cytochrome b6-f complex iron-sulfur subunit
MERQEFISKLSLGILMACTGCSLVSCGSKRDDPVPNPGGGTPPPAPGSGTVLTVDLTLSLLNIGDSKSLNGVMLVRIATGNIASSFIAVQSSCTHQGTSIDYNVAQAKFICPNHGSQFSQTGQVLAGPAVIALQRYTVSVNGTTAIVIT